MNRFLSPVALACAALLCVPLAEAATSRTAQQAVASDGVQLVPSGKGFGIPALEGQSQAVVLAGNGIDYHGGPVMRKGVNVYIIWYGNWATQGGPNAKAIVQDMFNTVGGTPYYNINTTYYQDNVDTKKNRVKNKVTLVAEIDDVNKSLGSALTDSNIRTLVANAITSGALPSDKNGLYFVLTTKDVNATSGFCTQYCGWHTHTNILGADIKYSFVGDAARCINSCAPQSTGPNGNAGVDGMASVIVHELEEAATDPALNAWWQTSTGMENADKCAWTFGSTYTTPNGALANVKWGSRDFMIQRNWVNANGGYCALQYP